MLLDLNALEHKNQRITISVEGLNTELERTRMNAQVSALRDCKISFRAPDSDKPFGSIVVELEDARRVISLDNLSQPFPEGFQKRVRRLFVTPKSK